MGVWNTFSFENDTTYDAIGVPCNYDRQHCGITGTSTMFSVKHPLTIQKALAIIKPVLTNNQFKKSLTWINNHGDEMARTGVIIFGIYAGAKILKKDVNRSLKYLRSEKKAILDGDDKGWKNPKSRLKSIDEEIEYILENASAC